MDYRYEEGVEQGKQDENRQTAINLKKSGIDLQTIVDCTGLAMEEVERL